MIMLNRYELAVLVKRLRAFDGLRISRAEGDKLAAQAANAIEALTAKLERAKEALRRARGKS